MTMCHLKKGVGICGAGFLLLLGTGCVTNSDLQKLNKDLSQRIDTMHKASESQMTGLRQDLKQDQARTLKILQAETAKVTYELLRVQQTMKQTLLGTYKVEEAALKERLRVLERVRMELEGSGSYAAQDVLLVH